MNNMMLPEAEKAKLQLILSYWQPGVDSGDQGSQDRVIALLVSTIGSALAGKAPDLNELEIRQYLDASRLSCDMAREIGKLEQNPATAMSAGIMRSALSAYENTLKTMDARCGIGAQPAAQRPVNPVRPAAPAPAPQPRQRQPEKQPDEMPSHIASRHRLWDDSYD